MNENIKEQLHFQLLNDLEPPPYDLLLLADEQKEAIDKYIFQSEIYLVMHTGLSSSAGVFVLYTHSEKTVEIKNIAVAEYLQGKGIGTYMLNYIDELSKRKKYSEIIVGTSDTNALGIAFYKKNGFTQFGVRKNFFIENYLHPMYDNGIMLKDMIMFKKVFDQ
jgi:ribosomal protein S18 acetylase RimI-like enzyme